MSEQVIAFTHHGMGRLDDGTLVPRVLPGEVVEIAEDGSPRILEPSVDRVKAICTHFKSCGGCSVMQASESFVANWKTGIVETALRAHAIKTEIKPIYTSPAQSRRRAKFSGRRTKKGAMVGFHATGSSTLIEVPGCQVLTATLKLVIDALQEITISAASRKSEAQYTVIDSENGPDVLVETDKNLTDQLRLEMAQLAQRHNIARLSWNDDVIVMREHPVIRFGSALVLPPPGAFLQATVDAQTKLSDCIQEIVGDAKRVLDLFSGCGTFSFPMAQSAEVHAVEGSNDLIDALDMGFRKTEGLKLITTEVRDLFRRPLEPDEFRHFDAVVVDPPRAGAEAQMQTLIKANISKVAMVSCNPVTFARDAKTLVDGGYTLNWIQPVDQFRWTAHVELVASFSKK